MSVFQKKSLHLPRRANKSMAYIVREASLLRPVGESGKFSNVSGTNVDSHSPLCRFVVGGCPILLGSRLTSAYKVWAVPSFFAYGYLPEPSDGKC